MARFIHLTSATPKSGKVRFNVDHISVYFKQGLHTAVICDGPGMPMEVSDGKIGGARGMITGMALAQNVTESPEEIDALLEELGCQHAMKREPVAP